MIYIYYIYCEIITKIGLVNIPHFNKKKKYPPVRTLEMYSLNNFPINHVGVSTKVIMVVHCIVSVYLSGPTSVGSSKKQESSRKNICFLDYAKAFDCVGHNKLWKILKEMGIPDHLTYLLRNLYSGQEVTEPDMGQQTASKLERSTSRLYIVPLLI